MPDEKGTRWLFRSVRSLQDNAQRAGPAATASYSLIGAILMFGGIGYAIDAWQGTAPRYLLGGLALGLVTGFYLLAKAMWQR
jgi:F0F1-type ATP synthase assembly protein I